MIHPDVEAAFEYARRYRKGLPSDRLCDGQKGAEAVARGIERLAQAVARQSVEEYQRGTVSMSVGAPEYPPKREKDQSCA